MRKLVASVAIFLWTFIITSNVDVYSIDLNNKNNYQNSNFFISYGGGGGGGGNSPKAKAKKKAKQEKAKLLFKKRQALKKISDGIPLTEEEKKILYFDYIAD